MGGPAKKGSSRKAPIFVCILGEEPEGKVTSPGAGDRAFPQWEAGRSLGRDWIFLNKGVCPACSKAELSVLGFCLLVDALLTLGIPMQRRGQESVR